MRRAAALDLCRHLSPEPPPALLSGFVEGDNDVGAGVARFLAATGGSAGALARLEHRVQDTSDPAATVAELVSGDRIRVHRTLAMLRSLAAPRSPWSAARRLPAAVLAGTRPRRVLAQAGTAAGEQRRLRRSLARSWPEPWLHSEAAAELLASIQAFDAAETQLLEALADGRDDAASLVAMTRSNGVLAALDEAARHTPAGQPAPKPGPLLNSLSMEGEALAQLTDALARTPDPAGAQAVWRYFRWRHHPARAGADEPSRARAARLAHAANRALDQWEASAGVGLGTP